MLDPEAQEQALARCREGIDAAAEAYAAARSVQIDSRTHVGPATQVGPTGGRVEPTRVVDALDFLLETLGKDLHDLIRVLQGPR